ncbi:MAG TPA: hypothetical protein VGO39_03285 [Gaiellaceae bacterium]|nr:hypothetical protein [Gaiellaceae bacterium]
MRLLALVVAVIVALAVTATAAADGLPVLGIDVGSQGVTAVGGADRYVTVDDGASTLVERIARNGGRVLGLQRIAGTFTIPAVAYDASASGLSADGRTLVLIQPRQAFPRAVTTFALLEVPSLRLQRTIALRGDFSFDAISTGGRTMYLINYTSPADPTRYTVRAYDLQAGALLPKPIVDPAERSDKMRGAPITRMLSVDGRWAYTLYDGAGGTPFVHALDTGTSRAHCIDLPMLVGNQNLWSLRFTRGPGGQISIGASGGQLAQLDTATFVASVPAVHAPSDLRSWLIAAAAVLAALVLLVALTVARRRRGRSGPLDQSDVLDRPERIVEVM